MSRFDPYLKTYVESKDGNGLRTEIADVWKSIRGTNLYSGGPRGAQTDRAIARSLAALRVASQTNDRALLAEACRLMAHTLNADEQYEQSIEYYQKAIALFDSCGSGEQAARTRLGFVAALYMMGKYDEAIEIAGQAEQWFQSNNHLLGLAKVYTNIGNLGYRREQYQVALQYHSKARVLFEQLKDWSALAMCYLNIANGLAFTEQIGEAEKMYDLSEEISARLNMQELFMQVRYNKSYLMFLAGRYAESLEAFKVVRNYFSKTGSRHHVNLCDLDVAEIYLHLVQPTEAVSFAQRAAEGFSKTAMRYEHAKAIAFSAMGFAQLDRLEEAEKAITVARKMFEVEKNRYWISIADFCLAYMQLAHGEVAKARLLSAQAKLQFQGMDIKGGMAESLSRLSSMALESSQVKTAASCMTEVLKLTINKRR
jgi:tetratricopeptide (TPR) repeat protein